MHLSLERGGGGWKTLNALLTKTLNSVVNKKYRLSCVLSLCLRVFVSSSENRNTLIAALLNICNSIRFWLLLVSGTIAQSYDIRWIWISSRFKTTQNEWIIHLTANDFVVVFLNVKTCVYLFQIQLVGLFVSKRYVLPLNLSVFSNISVISQYIHPFYFGFHTCR